MLSRGDTGEFCGWGLAGLISLCFLLLTMWAFPKQPPVGSKPAGPSCFLSPHIIPAPHASHHQEVHPSHSQQWLPRLHAPAMKSPNTSHHCWTTAWESGFRIYYNFLETGIQERLFIMFLGHVILISLKNKCLKIKRHNLLSTKSYHRFLVHPTLWMRVLFK